jgi:hypothetical protein
LVSTTVQRYTDEEVRKKAQEVWERKGKPENQTEQARQADYLEAKRELRAHEVWQEKGSHAGQSEEASRADFLQASSEVEESHRILEVVKAGPKDLQKELDRQAHSIWQAKGSPQNQPQEKMEEDQTAARKKILDLMQRGLSNEEFAFVAASLMLSVPESTVDSEDSKKKALEVLQAELFDKGIARRLVDQNTSVVVVPRSKKMTDLPEFASLAGTKTVDGRTWDSVRGSGGFKVPGKNQIYVAMTEENLTGKDAQAAAAGTSWCYDKGYSTSSHEMAHAIDQFALDAKDRAQVDTLYDGKKNSEKAGTAVEWIDGFNFYANVTDAQRNNLYTSIDAGLAAKLTTAGLAPAYHNGARTALYNTVVSKQPMDAAYGGWLVSAGVLTSDQSAVYDTASPPNRALEIDSKLATAPRKGAVCYAASHRLEYFAQTANAYFGTNAGADPYTGSQWTTAGEPNKGLRRNGKSEVARIEPDLSKMFERIFGKGEIKNANARP